MSVPTRDEVRRENHYCKIGCAPFGCNLFAGHMCSAEGCRHQTCACDGASGRCDSCESVFCMDHRLPYDGLQLCTTCREKVIKDANYDFAVMMDEVIKNYQDKLDVHQMYEWLQARSIRIITDWEETTRGGDKPTPAEKENGA